MQKYLMTWYGITDLKASLGLEQTTGPILGALLAEDYTDVVILGFTNPNKTENRISELQEKIAFIQSLDKDAAKEVINQFSNTVEAHNHIQQWLKNRLQAASKETNIQFEPVTLKNLNDTQGIYQAASQSLSAVTASKGEKQVTLYLSPGTPIMAFIWTFAATKYPDLNPRFIVSSQPGQAPEQIDLLKLDEKQDLTVNSQSDHYDVIFHLFSEQRIPVLLGINQFNCKMHVFVNTKQFPATVMRQFVMGGDFFELPVDPYSPENVRNEILKLVRSLPSSLRIGFNLTAGTKLMYAGALAACKSVNATPFYFDVKNNKVIFLDDFKSEKTVLIESVEPFISVNGNSLWISNDGDISQSSEFNSHLRNELTNELWKCRSKISKFYKKLVPIIDTQESFRFERPGIYMELSETLAAEIVINGRRFYFDHWPDFARYLCGGWFEEYAYQSLQPLLDSGKIKDLRLGLEVSIDDQKGYAYISEKNKPYQELDITFTDGRSLYIVECKAGAVKSDHIMKLQNIVRYFGGVSGQGILCCCFAPKNKVVAKKVLESGNVELVLGGDLRDQVEAMITKRSLGL
ncbi:MAG: hypothetical protein CSA51_01565 [Gammaproteobacteria bacterium]|nr:MAG: hypothetical protein CSA51_01565 [Gammaproteobacteria bacterium]